MFKEIPLGETNIQIIDGDRGKNYPKKDDFSKIGHTLFLSNKNIINNFLDDSFGEYITEEKSNSLRKGKLKRGDIVMSTRGSVGNIGHYSNKVKSENIRINSGMVIIRNRDSNIDNEFLYIVLRSNFMKKKYEEYITGSVQNQLPIRDLKKVPIVLPPLKVQLEIKKIISSMDYKIENNNAIIANLEEQGLSIFKEWFIESCNPNWKQGTISDLGTVVSGGTPSKKKSEYYTDGDIPWITPKDLSVNKSKFISRGTTNITKLGLKESSAKLVTPGTILFSSRAPIGYIAIAKNEVSTNQGFKSIEPYQNIGTAFVYYFLKTNVAMIENSASGSTFKEISGGAFKKLPAIIPDDEILLEFNKKCQPLFSLQEVLEEENTKLMEIRDTLLPKLMSGKIRVGDVGIEE